MQFLNYFFASIISYMGLLIGIMLIKIAPEEQNPLRKYFEFTKNLIMILIFLFLIFYYSTNSVYIIALLIYFIFIVFIEYNLSKSQKKYIIVYTALGIIFYLSSRNLNLFVMDSSLILLYGIPSASLMFNQKEKNYAEIFLHNIGFLLVANIAFFL